MSSEAPEPAVHGDPAATRRLDSTLRATYIGSMDVVQTTLQIYKRALQKAAKTFVSAPVALVGLVASQLAIGAFSFLISATLGAWLGPAGGFVAGLMTAVVSAVCTGAYLHVLENVLAEPKSVGFSTLADSLGVYARELLNVMFIIFIASMLAGLVLGPLASLVWLAVLLLCNPAPEIIYARRSVPESGLDTLRQAFEWTKTNGVEWLIPNIAIFAVYLAAGGAVSSIVASGAGWEASLLASATLALVFGHFVMLFRGALFKELDGSSRRSRAWKARTED